MPITCNIQPFQLRATENLIVPCSFASIFAFITSTAPGGQASHWLSTCLQHEFTAEAFAKLLALYFTSQVCTINYHHGINRPSVISLLP
jgi:hypothetical protein